MKRLFSLLLILAIIFVSNCSRIPENNDPVIGVWSNNSESSEVGKGNTKSEWIFNDAYMGRYNSYSSNDLMMKTDFQWSEEDGQYTITYPGTDLSNHIVTMQHLDGQTLLIDTEGTTVAVRE